MPAPPKVLVAVATYNEIENLPRLVEEIFAALPEAHLLVVDDNSPDGTGQWCERKSAEDPRVRCLRREGKQGLGTAILAAMDYAQREGYDYLLTMDADLSHPPRYLPELLRAMDAPDSAPLDVVLGSRYVPGGGARGLPLSRRLMSRAINGYARWALGLPARDCSGNFRCYRLSILRRLDPCQVRSRGYSFQEEILWHLCRAGARIGETPIVFVDRQRGASKIDLAEALWALWIIFRLGARNLFGRRAPRDTAGLSSSGEDKP